MAKPDYPEHLIKELEEHYGTDDWDEISSLMARDIRPKVKNVGKPPDPEVTKRRWIVFNEMVKRTFKGGMKDRPAAKKVAEEFSIKSALDDWKDIKRGLKNPDPDKIDKEFDRVAKYGAIQLQERMRGSNLKELAQLCFGSDDKSTQERVRPLYERLREET
jgi:hypothetical protein